MLYRWDIGRLNGIFIGEKSHLLLSKEISPCVEMTEMNTYFTTLVCDSIS